jgi:hypothetical protein
MSYKSQLVKCLALALWTLAAALQNGTCSNQQQRLCLSQLSTLKKIQANISINGCCLACANEVECVSWTLSGTTCILTSEVGKRTNGNCFSGLIRERLSERDISMVSNFSLSSTASTSRKLNTKPTILQYNGIRTTKNTKILNKLLKTFSTNGQEHWDLSGGLNDSLTNKFEIRNAVTQRRGTRVSSWASVEETLHAGGHEFCGVVKDIWSCDGDHYINVLQRTKPFNESIFDSLTNGITIFGDGNSYFCELWAPVLCLPSIKLWKIDAIYSNSWIAYDPEKDILLLLLDNDWVYNEKYQSQSQKNLLVKHDVKPSVVLLGLENIIKGKEKRGQIPIDASGRINFTQHLFPNVPIIKAFGQEALQSDDCKAFAPHDHVYEDSLGNCSTVEVGHACYPGPVLRGAEFMWNEVVNILK